MNINHTVRKFGAHTFAVFLLLFFIACGNQITTEVHNTESNYSYHWAYKRDEILFVNSETYYDQYWYSFNIEKGKKYAFELYDRDSRTWDERDISGFETRMVGDILFSIFDSEGVSYVEASDNTTSGEKLEIIAQNSGEMYIKAEPKTKTSDSRGGFEIIIEAENIKSSIELEKVASTPHYMLKAKDTADFSVGNMIPIDAFYLELYWGPKTKGSEFVSEIHYISNGTVMYDSGYVFLLKEGEQTFSVLADDGNWCEYTFTIKNKENSKSKLSIEIPSDAKFMNGTCVGLKARYEGSDITESAAWYSFNEDDEDTNHIKISNGEAICQSEGNAFIIAKYNNECVFDYVTITSNNPYKITPDSENFVLLGNMSFTLLKDGQDVSSEAEWICEDEFVDFDTLTHTAYFYGGGKEFSIRAKHNGTVIIYKNVINDTKTINLDFSMPFEKLSFGNSESIYTIKLSGEYDDDKFDTLIKKLEEMEKQFSFNMFYVTGLTELTKKSIFKNCDTIISLVLPNGLKEIGTAAFSNSTSIRTVTIPSTVEKIGDGAFQLCPSLRTVMLPKNLKTIGYAAFYMCSSLSSISLPQGLESIGRRAFYQTGISSFTIPESVIAIDAEALLSSKLTSLTFEFKNWYRSDKKSYRISGSKVTTETATEAAAYYRTFGNSYFYSTIESGCNVPWEKIEKQVHRSWKKGDEYILSFPAKAGKTYHICWKDKTINDRYFNTDDHWADITARLATSEDFSDEIYMNGRPIRYLESGAIDPNSLNLDGKSDSYVPGYIFTFDEDTTVYIKIHVVSVPVNINSDYTESVFGTTGIFEFVVTDEREVIKWIY